MSNKKKEKERLQLEKEMKDEKITKEVEDLSWRLNNLRNRNYSVKLSIRVTDILHLPFSKEAIKIFIEKEYDNLISNINEDNFVDGLNEVAWMDALGQNEKYKELYLKLGREIFIDWFKRLRFSSMLFYEFFYFWYCSEKNRLLSYISRWTDISPDKVATEVMDFYETSRHAKIYNEDMPSLQYSVDFRGYPGPSLIHFSHVEGSVHRIEYNNQSAIEERYFVPLKDNLETLEDEIVFSSKNIFQFMVKYVESLTTDQRYITLRNKEILEEIVNNRVTVEGVEKRVLTKTSGRFSYISGGARDYERSFKSTKGWLDYFLKNLNELKIDISKEEIEILGNKALKSHAVAVAKAVGSGELKCRHNNTLMMLLEENKDYETLKKIYCESGEYKKEAEMMEKLTN